MLQPQSMCTKDIRYALEGTYVDEESDNVEYMNTIPTIKLSKEDKRRIRAPYTQVVICKAFGRSLEYQFFNSTVRQLWNPHGEIQVINLGRGFFIVHFIMEDDFFQKSFKEDHGL